MDENIKCPICHQPAKIGYACGDYFMHCSDGCPSPMCDHPTESVTLASWLDWVKWYNCNQPDNNPLTLDELWRMDGEPVWIVAWPDWGHWELSAHAEDYFEDRDPDFYGMMHNDPHGRYGLHMLGWLAYRSRPGRNK